MDRADHRFYNGMGWLQKWAEELSDCPDIQAAYITARFRDGLTHLKAIQDIVTAFGLPYPEHVDLPPNLQVQLRYIESRMLGTSHSLAEMFALRQAPDIRTDNTFFAGMSSNDQFANYPWLGDMYAEEARAAGVSITGKVYKSSIAEFPGDPRAWVSNTGDIIRVCEENGMSLTMNGRLIVKPREEQEDEEPADVDPDIVDQFVMVLFDRNEGLEEECLANPKKLQETRELARDTIKPSWVK